MRAAQIAWIGAFVLTLGGSPERAPAQARAPLPPGTAPAQALTVDLCPPTIVNTCYIGYVTEPDRLLVLLKSGDDDPIIGEEVTVSTGPSEGPPFLDLAPHRNRVVMIDGRHRRDITDAKLVFVADPLVTALYVATFMGDGGTPQDDILVDPGRK